MHAGGKAAVNACWRRGRCECIWRQGRNKQTQNLYIYIYIYNVAAIAMQLLQSCISSGEAAAAMPLQLTSKTCKNETS
jgi:hypothetical protein